MFNYNDINTCKAINPFQYHWRIPDYHLDEVNHLIDTFKKLKKVLSDTDIEYDEVLSEYGEEVARLYDNAPNDPQCDYQYKCYLSSMELHGYDENGDLYIQYIR